MIRPTLYQFLDEHGCEVARAVTETDDEAALLRARSQPVIRLVRAQRVDMPWPARQLHVDA